MVNGEWQMVIRQLRQKQTPFTIYHSPFTHELARLRTYPQHTLPLLPLLRSRPGGVHKASVVRSPKSDKSFPIADCRSFEESTGIIAQPWLESQWAFGNWQSPMFWRKGWDSNPRCGSPHTAFPVLPVKPLLHLSYDKSDE